MDQTEKNYLSTSSENQRPKIWYRGTENIILSQEIMSGDALLSFAQQRIWFLEQLTSGSPANHVSDGLLIRGQVDVPGLEKSLNYVIRRHQILRTIFHEVNGVPAQQILPHTEIRLTQIDLCQLNAEKKKEKIQELSIEQANERFDLGTAPLMKLTLLHTEPKE
jgi:hypothetical protein